MSTRRKTNRGAIKGDLALRRAAYDIYVTEEQISVNSYTTIVRRGDNPLWVFNDKYWKESDPDFRERARLRNLLGLSALEWRGKTTPSFGWVHRQRKGQRP